MAESGHNSAALVSSTGGPGGPDTAPSGGPMQSLLVVVGEPFTDEQKRLVIERLSNELLSWDMEASGSDLNLELQSFIANAAAADGQSGEKMIEYNTQTLHIVVLINPLHKTLVSKLRTFLLTPGTYRHLVHAGQAIQRSGCWVLQDSVFSFSALVDLFRGADVCTAIKSGAVGGVVNLNVFAEGEWAHVNKLAPQLQINVNRPAALQIENFPGIAKFCNYLSSIVTVTKTQDLLQSTTVIGNIRFNRPTLYVFPGAQGDSALFGISGFNLLVDGGYGRRACFWDFTRHLDRIDALLVTHMGVDNLFGLGAVVERKAQEPGLHPEIGYVYMNACTKGKEGNSEEGSVEAGGREKKGNGSLLLSLSHEASHIVDNIRSIGLTTHPCVSPSQGTQPINLYHKVGSGSLDMYVLNPAHDSKTLKDFIGQWSKHVNGFSSAKAGVIPLAHFSSVCALVVWKPASHTEAITRILFTGATPQPIVFEGLDRLKGISLFQSAACSEKDLVCPAKATARKGSVKATSAAQPHQKPAAVAAKPEPAAAAGTSHAKPSSAAAAGKSSNAQPAIPNKSDTKDRKPIQKKETSHANTSTTKLHKDTKAATGGKSPVNAAAAVQVGITETQASPEESLSSANTTASMQANAESLSGQTSADATPLTEADTLQASMDAQQEFGAEESAIAGSPEHHPSGSEEATHDHDSQHESIVSGSHDFSGSEKLDADKDLDTSNEHAQSTHDHAHAEDEIFDGESPNGLIQPSEDQHLIRSDSLEGDLHEAPIDESNQPKLDLELVELRGVDEEHEPAVSPFSQTNNLLDMADLQSEAAGNISQSNPFVGISNFGDNGGVQTAGDVKNRSGEAENREFAHEEHGVGNVGAGMLDEEHVARDVDRDSLEREEAFDPRTNWDQPMNLPAPNKPPGSSKSDHDVAQAGENSVAKKNTSMHAAKPAPGGRTNGKGEAAAGAAASNDDSKTSESARKPPATLGKKGRPSTSGSGDAHASIAKETKPDVKPPSAADKPASAKTQQFKKPAGVPPKTASTHLKPVVPFYVELAYIPAHGNPAYLDGDFFRRVRARYYVLSTTSPDASVLTSLLEAKASWDDQDAMVTIIPTYDADVLRYWMGAHRDTLSQMKIDVAPSANRCSIQLQDQEASSAAYRLEF